jgi:hypothetical protein
VARGLARAAARAARHRRARGRDPCPLAHQGRSIDDFILVAAGEHADIALGRPPADLFVFANGKVADAERLRAEGVFPWWADPTTRVHLFRPLTSLTHSFDHAMWPASPAADHAQSVAWYLLLLGAVWLLLRRSSAPRWLSVFALLLFALYNTPRGGVGWIASRNGVIATTFGVLALWAHDRWRRDGWRAGALFGPLLLALAMGAGEAGVATLGYLVAYAAFLDEGTWRQRVGRIVPYMLVVAGFGGIYAIGGYGARNSSMYIDPVGEPLRFATALASQLPTYLHALLGGPPSEAWNIYGLVSPTLPYVMWALAVLTLATFGWVARPILLRNERENRFWLAGAVLAAIPICASMPNDRKLLFSSLGIVAVAPRFIVAVVRGADTIYSMRRQRWLAKAFAVWMFVAFVPLSVLGLATHANDTRTTQRPFARADASLPADASIADKTLVLVNPPLEPLVSFTLYQRAARGALRPALTRTLGTSIARELRVERVDARTLRVSCEAGTLSRTSDMMMRSPARDLRPGARVDLPGVSVEVERVTSDGRPASTLFRFERGLDDPSIVWMQWGEDGFTTFTPPTVGAATTLPAVDLVKLFTET